MTTRKTFIKIGIVSSVQFVDDHFPDWVASGWASLGITVAFVGHSVVKSVGPDGNTTEWCSDGCIVDKELICHHFKLLVASYSQVWGTDSNDGTIGDVSKPLNDQPSSGHLSQPVIICSFSPVFRIILVGNREDSNFVTPSVQFLNSRVITVLVRHIEGSLQTASIGVDPITVKDLLEDSNVV